jgi:superfamily II DNA or RNA helicase
MQIDDLLKKLPPDNFGKGDAFEKLVKWWLQNDAVWRGLLKPNTVKLWNESPHRQGRDIGIDLTAEDYLGHVWAIQAKNWKEETSLPKSEIDKFLSASNTRNFQKRLLVTTTSSISSNAVSAMDHQEKEAKKVTIHDLRESNVEWQLYLDNPKANATKAVKIPFPHQKDAIKNTVKGLKENKRGQLIMACGSGKTITAQRIDEELESKITLVLVPSLLLVQQTLKSWREETRKDFLSMAVCSDDTVTNDSAVGKVSDLSIPVTTNSKEIKEFLKLKGRKVIFSTYQSSSKIAKAIKGTKHKFDLIIADEAHRLAGTVDKEYGAVLQKNALPSKHYLFMTATPRIFTANVQKTASERGVEVYSMDDENIFGKQLHNYSFADAIRDGVLTDYRVVVVGVDDPMLADMIDQRELVRAGDIDTDAKTLASHIGLAKAMRDYKLNRVISFHSRIKSAKTFADQHPKIREWMKEPNIKSTNLTTLTISGQDSSDARKTVLDQLKEVDINSQGLVTNARCLTEGVDVPTLDGIAFIDPRASQVDIVQAVGRAIRKGGDEKKFGYIVIPLFFSQQELHEEAINESVFKPVWNVINALKSHDAELIKELDSIRFSLGKNQRASLDNTKIQLNLPKFISNDIINLISTKIIKGSTQSWYEIYAYLLNYVEKFDDCNPPRGYLINGFDLGTWTQNQRYRKERLDLTQVNLLETIHPKWSWNILEEQWSTGFVYLKEYLTEYGNLDVPQNYVNKSGFKLGSWIGRQRRAKKDKTIEIERKELLESLPLWSWNTRETSWDKFFKEYKQFFNLHSHSRIPHDFETDEGLLLGDWLYRQKNYHLNGKLSPTKIKLMKEVDPSWAEDKSEQEWKFALELMKEYYKKNGNINFPKYQKIINGVNLRTWKQTQRVRYKKRTLSETQIKMLEDSFPDWSWDPYDDNWNESFAELIEYIAEKGTSLVPRAYKTRTGLSLGTWLSRQRDSKRKGILGKHRIDLLNNCHPDFVWSFEDVDPFIENYKIYISEINRLGHGNLSNSHITPDGHKIGNWLNWIRQLYRKDKLSPDKVKLLINSHKNWSWDPNTDSWNKNFEDLRNFIEKHKSIPTGKNTLGNWVVKQKSLYKKGLLDIDKINKFEKEFPNWTWINLKDDSWENHYQVYLNYVKVTGSCKIDRKFISDSGFKIGSWAYTQRADFKRNKLTLDRVKKLEAINGWKWDWGTGGKSKKI